MVLADVAFVSAEIIYYDKKTDYSNCCKQDKNFLPKGSGLTIQGSSKQLITLTGPISEPISFCFRLSLPRTPRSTVKMSVGQQTSWETFLPHPLRQIMGTNIVWKKKIITSIIRKWARYSIAVRCQFFLSWWLRNDLWAC